ncbi:hypothetical protein MPTK2_3g01390 [Marchantia polymorpha subsp. ruderalis]
MRCHNRELVSFALDSATRGASTEKGQQDLKIKHPMDWQFHLFVFQERGEQDRSCGSLLYAPSCNSGL